MLVRGDKGRLALPVVVEGLFVTDPSLDRVRLRVVEPGRAVDLGERTSLVVADGRRTPLWLTLRSPFRPALLGLFTPSVLPPVGRRGVWYLVLGLRGLTLLLLA